MALVHKTVQRVGNSSGVVLPPEILKEAGFERGDEIIIRAERGQIVISPRVAIREEVIQAAETVIARYDAVFRKLAQ
ncbi:MAG: AbrB/MazE/SpoVT family DNA-binding domain-containing protein [Pseudomonadota bacterium]|nr:AbrB/MazE/SpoVT family DNA-binding domain-containing protein [Pseudomonadota bacterium]